MRREPHVRFREGGGVKLLSATRPVSGRTGVVDQKEVEPKSPHYMVVKSALLGVRIGGRPSQTHLS